MQKIVGGKEQKAFDIADLKQVQDKTKKVDLLRRYYLKVWYIRQIDKQK